VSYDSSPFSRSNWTVPETVIFGVPITEYDMADAGMTVIREEQLLEPARIDWLASLPKGPRAVAVGKLNREVKGIMSTITAGIKARIKEFCDVNKVGADRVVSIKRDAVFLAGAPVQNLNPGGITKFRRKGSYTAFARLGVVEIYCTPRTGAATVKGLRDGGPELHAEFTTRFVVDILGLLEGREGRRGAAATIQQFREDYLARRVPAGFFRELNADSQFAVRSGNTVFLADSVADFDPAMVEIGYNLRNVIIPLAGAVA